MYYLAHPARKSLTRVWVLRSKLSSITWSHSHLVRAPFTQLANSAAQEGGKKSPYFRDHFSKFKSVKSIFSQTGASVTHQE